MQSTHVNALETKHAGLERQIHAEQLRPIPDSSRIQALKRQKLKIKEEIALG